MGPELSSSGSDPVFSCRRLLDDLDVRCEVGRPKFTIMYQKNIPETKRFFKVIWEPCLSVTSIYYRGAHKRMQGKIKKLAEELVIDAMRKVDSVQHFKNELKKYTPYQYGLLMYEMKYRHNKMYKLYAKVADIMESSPILDGDDEVNKDNPYIVSAFVEVDDLAHEIYNFAAMIKLHDANKYADKSTEGWDLHFRRSNLAPEWLALIDSLNTDNNNPPEQVPENNNQTHTSKRINGEWHQAVPIN